MVRVEMTGEVLTVSSGKILIEPGLHWFILHDISLGGLSIMGEGLNECYINVGMKCLCKKRKTMSHNRKKMYIKCWNGSK